MAGLLFCGSLCLEGLIWILDANHLHIALICALNVDAHYRLPAKSLRSGFAKSTGTAKQRMANTK